MTYQQVFVGLGKHLDNELDQIIPVLMTKTGDPSSAFIREDAERALEAAVDNCSSTKCLNLVVASGAK